MSWNSRNNNNHNSTSFTNNGNNTTGPRAKCDQVIYEAVCKACEIIVQSRAQVNSAGPTSSNASSSRFNLTIPELDSVRNILNKYKQSMHVPFRLDVYYQLADRRELLERWAFEYVPAAHGIALNYQSSATDPMAQLRHVCKCIVIWLRTLYCYARLLPAANIKQQNLGFSIYSPTHTADMQELYNQGFVETAPPSHVKTPYGQLEWRVASCDKTTLERIKSYEAPAARTLGQPIPVPRASNEGSWQASDEEEEAYNAAAPQSLPATTSRMHVHDHSPLTPQPTTYDAHRKFYRAHSTREESDQPQQHASLLQRRHTTLDDSKQPERIMSGLSLALLMEEHMTDEEKKQRRAALHEVPRHVLEQQQQHQQQSANVAEYGYAYNNHIPWQRIHPSATPAMLGRSPSVDSPALLSTTPPGAAFLGAGMMTPLSLGPLIPPRGSTTPPFPSRPVGFTEVPSEQQQNEEATLPPSPALDLLHTSPFQQPPFASQQLQHHSILSSLSHNPDDYMRKSLWPSADSNSFWLEQQQHFTEEDHDMPFAVDDACSEWQAAAASSQLASFAQKCTPTASRLDVFSTSNHHNIQLDVDDLTNQLDEFKSFGASLHASNLQ